MSAVDYMKVIDIISRLVGAKDRAEVDATHDKVDIFDVKVETIENETKFFQVRLKDYDLEIVFPKTFFKEDKRKKDFNKLISELEYEMEQSFFINVKFEINEDLVNYKVKIPF